MKKLTCIILCVLIIAAAGAPAFASDTPTSWAAERVNAAIAAGLVPQTLQSSYTQATTRAEFCALAVTLYEKLKGEIRGRKYFTDTDDVNVEKLASLNVVSGVNAEGTLFNPDVQLTREMAATLLSQLASALGEPLPLQEADFADKAGFASWSAAAVGRVQAAGIMGSTSSTENLFSPQEPYTREQSIITVLLMFEYTGVAEIVIKGESYMTNLERLNLVDKGLTNADIEPLKYMTNLTTLFLAINQISDISVLSSLPNLKNLYLSGNQISDISALFGLTNLEILELNENPLTDEQIFALRAALPNCNIRWEI